MSNYESLNAQCFAKRKYRPLFGAANRLPDLLYAAHVREEISQKHPRIMHSHKDLAEIVLIYQGAGNYMIHNRKYHVRKGDLLIYNAGVVHDENPVPDSNLAFYTIAVGSLQFPGLPKNTVVPESMGVRFPTEGSFQDLHDLFRMIFDNLAADTPGSERFCNNLLYAILSKILTIATETCSQARDAKSNDNAKKSRNYLPGSGGELSDEKRAASADDGEDIFESPGLLTDKVMEYVDQNYMNPITIQDIADALYASPYYIAHIFKRETGYSPIQYLLRRRIGEAQTLLINTDKSIVEISGMVGYDTQSYFTSQFTRYVGMPPRQYRLKYRI